MALVVICGQPCSGKPTDAACFLSFYDSSSYVLSIHMLLLYFCLPFTFSVMEEQTLFSKLMINLRATCKYYTGYPKDLGPSKVIHFTSEREFVQLLHQGHRVVVAFTVKGNYTRHLDKVLEEAAAEFYPNVKFLRVECPKYPGFCITRQRKEYPFVEIFHSPEQALNQGKAADPNITRYSVKVLPFNYDLSAYGFREFFKRHGIQSSDPQ
nr:Thioredoxin-like protein [Ipomoea batatas]GMD21084.1 Thioredoxin-like protein [Ipomoea batatas]